MGRFLLATLLAASVAPSNTSGQEPVDNTKSFEGPRPRAVTSDYLPYYLPSSLPQPGTREVWQYYGVDGRGRWVARVILAPAGAYYYYNGAPFLYTTTQPRLYMPYVVD